MLLILCVDNHSIAHIKRDMAVVAHDISCSGLIERINGRTDTAVGNIIVRKAETEVSINCHYETGAVRTVSQT